MSEVQQELNTQRSGQLRVLTIGPLPPRSPTKTNPVGGASVNFAEMVRQLALRNLDLEVIDTSRPRVNLGGLRVWHDVAAVLRLVGRLVVRIRSSDVVLLNISAGSAWLLGSAIWALCAVWRRPIALRFFGGDFGDRYAAYGPIVRWWSDATYMRSSLIFVQTKDILERFGGRRNFRWFANTRDVRTSAVAARGSMRRLVFISQLRMEKGLGETLEACRQLGTDCHLDVYGPVMPNTDLALLESHEGATYRGVLDRSEVADVLGQSDVLVFPTYWKSEGYPGIVLEAFQCGRPVISTWWGSVPEVVEHEKSGLLVEPRSAVAVRDAIERLIRDEVLYRRLCAGARRRGEFFRSSRWYDGMVAELRRVARA